MTADDTRRGSGAEPPGPRLSVDLFLLAGQFPGTGHATTLRRAVDYARAAEVAGFDGVWIAEHHFITYGVCPSAVTLAGYVLGATRRLRVGTAAAILSNRHPVALAEEAALLDAVSGGRFDLGVARGGPWIDLDVFGTGLARYTDGFPEALDLLLAALSGRHGIGADGEHFRFPEVAMIPRPPRPLPTWVAATSSSTVDVAARRRLPLLLGMHDDDRAKAAMLNAYAGAATAAGHDPTGVAHASAHLTFVADTTDLAEKALRAAMPGWLARTGEYRRVDGNPPRRRDLSAYLDRLLAIHPVGPPRRCLDRLTTTLDVTGAHRLLLMVEGTGDPGRTVDGIHRLGADVLPPLRAHHRPASRGHMRSRA